MQNKSKDGPFNLKEIEEALIMRALQHGFLVPLMTFFQLMELRWGDTATAHATIIDGKRVIELGRDFFTEEVRDIAEAVDVLMHEIMHHIFRHLFLHKLLLAQGYSHNIQGLAQDAIINAYLHAIGCSGFDRRYYGDIDEYALLRPGSRVFKITHDQERQIDSAPADSDKARNFLRRFHRRLYKLQVTLEEALKFYQTNFPQPELRFPPHRIPRARRTGTTVGSVSSPRTRRSDHCLRANF